MIKNFHNIAWYPPAETEIPFSTLMLGFAKGPAKFKEDLCRTLAVDHCILGNSARALLYKLLVALHTQDKKGRNEVLIPGYTCYSVAAAIAKAGFKIGLYDLDTSTLNPDMESFEKAINEKTLAVVTQHLFGLITPMEDIKKITERYGTFLIEDAAQAFDIENSEIAAGTYGDFGLLSFGRGKPLPIGNGGALISRRHSETIDNIIMERPHNGYGQVFVSVATKILSKPAFYWIPEALPLGLGNTVFSLDFKSLPMSRSINKISSSALKGLNSLNRHRKRIADVYTQYLHDQCQIKNQNNNVSMIRFPVFLPKMKMRNNLIRLGIRKMYPKAIMDECVIRSFIGNHQAPTPGAAKIAMNLYTLPTHKGINREMAMKISIEINKYIDRG